MQFKAKKLNKKILDQPDFVPQVNEKLLTETKPFALKTDDRVGRKPLKIQEPTQFKAKDMPEYKFFRPSIIPKSPTRPEEFRLTIAPTRERESLSADHQFKARGVPDFNRLHNRMSLKPLKIKEPTFIESFNFATDGRTRATVMPTNY